MATNCNPFASPARTKDEIRGLSLGGDNHSKNGGGGHKTSGNGSSSNNNSGSHGMSRRNNSNWSNSNKGGEMSYATGGRSSTKSERSYSSQNEGNKGNNRRQSGDGRRGNGNGGMGNRSGGGGGGGGVRGNVENLILGTPLGGGEPSESDRRGGGQSGGAMKPGDMFQLLKTLNNLDRGQDETNKLLHNMNGNISHLKNIGKLEFLGEKTSTFADYLKLLKELNSNVLTLKDCIQNLPEAIAQTLAGQASSNKLQTRSVSSETEPAIYLPVNTSDEVYEGVDALSEYDKDPSHHALNSTSSFSQTDSQDNQHREVISGEDAMLSLSNSSSSSNETYSATILADPPNGATEMEAPQRQSTALSKSVNTPLSSSFEDLIKLVDDGKAVCTVGSALFDAPPPPQAIPSLIPSVSNDPVFAPLPDSPDRIAAKCALSPVLEAVSISSQAPASVSSIDSSLATAEAFKGL